MSETRALNAALSGPVFQGAATRSALHASERHVDRWAPEGPAATRSRGLRSLAFADRVASPWMSAAMQSRGASMMRHGSLVRSVAASNGRTEFFAAPASTSPRSATPPWMTNLSKINSFDARRRRRSDQGRCDASARGPGW